ncbi:MAG TPA: HD domain-containing protein [Clostridia bacterium]|nr:HD domain-containing protein [Clostridia bacterium]
MERKGTATPYILHPLEAAAIVGTMTDDQEIIAAAMLHDVIEDASVAVEQLQQIFGERIAALVAAETENKRENLPAADTWQVRKEEAIGALCDADLPVKMIALADKLSNIRAIYRDYHQIGDRLWDRFNQKDKAKHGWYYQSVVDATKELAAYPAWQEYDCLVRYIFGQSELNIKK